MTGNEKERRTQQTSASHYDVGTQCSGWRLPPAHATAVVVGEACAASMPCHCHARSYRSPTVAETRDGKRQALSACPRGKDATPRRGEARRGARPPLEAAAHSLVPVHACVDAEAEKP
ncbi:hypothetical protein SEVIR_5G432450v4 [Setaria viridis]